MTTNTLLGGAADASGWPQDRLNSLLPVAETGLARAFPTARRVGASVYAAGPNPARMYLSWWGGPGLESFVAAFDDVDGLWSDGRGHVLTEAAGLEVYLFRDVAWPVLFAARARVPTLFDGDGYQQLEELHMGFEEASLPDGPLTDAERSWWEQLIGHFAVPLDDLDLEGLRAEHDRLTALSPVLQAALH